MVPGVSLGAGVLRLRRTCRTAALRAADVWRRLGGSQRKPVLVVGCFSQRFDGNAFDFAIHAARDSRVRVVAVVRNDAEGLRLRALGVRSALRGSFKEHFVLRLADAVFTVGNVESDFSTCPNPSALRVMLWHATPMKAVGKLNKPIPDPIGHYDIVTATSEFTARIMRDAFASEGTAMAITGHPKTDRLLAEFDPGPLRAKLDIPTQARVVAYLPTWRHDFDVEQGGDFGRDAGPLLGVMRNMATHRRFLDLLERSNLVFLLKPHPLDDLDALRGIGNASGDRIRLLDPDGADTVDLMRLSDILVTDYSGALTDWLLLGKPVICFTYDYEEYWTHRGSPSFDYRETFGEIMEATVDGLVTRLEAYLRSPGCQPAAVARLSRLLHRHRDSGASRRILDETIGVLRTRASRGQSHG